MTSEAWKKLKTGSIVRMRKSRVLRRVIKKSEPSQCITLVMVVGGKRRLWCGWYRDNVAGKSTTVYCMGDKKMFEVYRY